MKICNPLVLDYENYISMMPPFAFEFSPIWILDNYRRRVQSKTMFPKFISNESDLQEDGIEIIGDVWGTQAKASFSLIREDVDWFEVRVLLQGSENCAENGEYQLVIPFELLRSAWVGPGGKLTLMLWSQIETNDRTKGLTFRL